MGYVPARGRGLGQQVHQDQIVELCMDLAERGLQRRHGLRMIAILLQDGRQQDLVRWFRFNEQNAPSRG